MGRYTPKYKHTGVRSYYYAPEKLSTMMRIAASEGDVETLTALHDVLGTIREGQPAEKTLADVCEALENHPDLKGKPGAEDLLGYIKSDSQYTNPENSHRAESNRSLQKMGRVVFTGAAGLAALAAGTTALVEHELLDPPAAKATAEPGADTDSGKKSFVEAHASKTSENQDAKALQNMAQEKGEDGNPVLAKDVREAVDNYATKLEGPSNFAKLARTAFNLTEAVLLAGAAAGVLAATASHRKLGQLTTKQEEAQKATDADVLRTLQNTIRKHDRAYNSEIAAQSH